MLAFLDGPFQRAVRLAGAALVGPVEDAEVLADDLVGGVADHVLGRLVPARHPARRVEQEDRVVDDAFDQDLKMAAGAVEREVRLRELPVQLLLRAQQARFGVLGASDRGAEHERRQ